MSAPYYEKWHDPYVFFLDEGFDCDAAWTALTSKGYEVHRHGEHFVDSVTGERLKKVHDTEVMHLANKHRFTLVTTDASMIHRHRVSFVKCGHLAILATAHNSVTNIYEWIDPLLKILPSIDKNSYKKKIRPWAICFDRSGKVTVQRFQDTPSKKAGAA